MKKFYENSFTDVTVCGELCQNMVLWLLPLVELSGNQMFRSGVRCTFCKISRRVFGVRKSSWVFWKAGVALFAFLVTKTRNQKTRNQIALESKNHFLKNRDFLRFFLKKCSKIFLKHFFKNLSCAFSLGVQNARKRCFS